MSTFILPRFLQDLELEQPNEPIDTFTNGAEGFDLDREGSTRLSDEEFVSRSLEENQFWLRIMMEHAFFLRMGFPPDALKLIKRAQEFEDIFDRQLERAYQTAAEPDAVRRLNEDTLILTHKIALFKQNVLEEVMGKLRGFNMPLLIEHVRREALYFLKTLKQINNRRIHPVADDIVDENIFFLQIMAEHSKFIAHLLDPTEELLVQQAREFGQTFDLLLYQAKHLDFGAPSSPLVRNQLTIYKGAAMELRTFKEQATKLIETCQVRSVIDPKLASHVTREAAKFLSIIDQLEARL
ncbi:DUF2935 domain-containing protein [Paenibacillus sp. GD4]|uniref:DUF2935 domain-containing protein n=1 Tax=Paenibacillus sp. GD4 TaxID=3068890 RepID=UPI0027965821|nr:DUF2935 domain-containing protein [Paenibacillus sp. GD4]MDQ1912538.1 DUF2935 domain-containing protein [Paenibacillus sp. GD4]